MAVQDDDRAEPHVRKALEDGGEHGFGDRSRQAERVRLRDAAGRPPGRRGEHGVRTLRGALGDRRRLQKVEPERQVVAVPLDRPERQDERRALGEPRLELGGAAAPPGDGSLEAHHRTDAAVRRLVERVLELVERDPATDQIGDRNRPVGDHCQKFRQMLGGPSGAVDAPGDPLLAAT